MLVTQSNSPITTTRVGYSDDEKLDCCKFGERGEELKVPHHASAAAARDGNLPYVKATCLNLP